VAGLSVLALAVAPVVASGRPARSHQPSCHHGVWCSMRSARYPFEVWIKGTANSASDQLALAATESLVDSLWGPETKLMGPPLPDVPRGHGKEPAGDTGNDSSRIDIYIVPPGVKFTRAGEQQSTTAIAETDPTATSARHHPRAASSAFLLVRRDRLGSPGFKSDIAHEFFHLLQDAHNAYTKQQCPDGSFWFREATATWAESYFVPETAADEVYRRWFAAFQAGSDQSHSWGMENTDGNRPYMSFIWPYFMQQQVGAAAIARAFKAMETAKTCEQMMKDTDAQLSFARHFHEFALRNLDESDTFDHGNLGAIVPRYQTLHKDFPDHRLPPIKREQLTPASGNSLPVVESLHVPALRAWYYQLDVSSDVGQVDIDTSGLSPQGSWDVDAVKRVNGSWQVQKLGPGKTQICTSPDSVPEIYLVVSNHSIDPNSVLGGSLKISSPVVPCNCPDFTKVQSFTGTASFAYSNSASGSPNGDDSESISLSHNAAGLQLSLPANPSDVNHAAFDGPVSGGTIAVHQVDDYTASDNTQSHTTADANGPPDPQSSTASVEFTPASCTYTLNVSGVTATAYAGNGPPADDGGIVDDAFSGSKQIPAGLDLSGSISIKAYQTGPTDPASIDAGFYTLFFAPGETWASEMWNVSKTDPQAPYGTATFSWNLKPTFGAAADRGSTRPSASRRPR
jgi:hypothetical protein